MTEAHGGTEPLPDPLTELPGVAPGAFSFADHYIVCGGNALAHRLIAELIEHYQVPVVAIVPDRGRDHGPRIEQLDGVTAVLEYTSVTQEALVAAARGIALVDGDDQANIHAALSAQGMNREIRIVLRMFNQRLGEQIQSLLTNCAALSGSATAAPAFANGALSRPNSVLVGDRYLYVAYDYDPAAGAGHLCVAADRIDRQNLDRLRLLPETPSAARPFIDLAEAVEGMVGPRPGRARRRTARRSSPSRSRMAWRCCRPCPPSPGCGSRCCPGCATGSWTPCGSSPAPGSAWCSAPRSPRSWPPRW